MSGKGEHVLFKDLFVCSVCRRHTPKPLYFPCGDIICQDCFRKLTNTGDDPLDEEMSMKSIEENYISCPFCRKKATTKTNKLALLNQHIFKNLNIGNQQLDSTNTDLTKLDGKSGKVGCSVCSRLGTPMVVAGVNQCLDCMDILCSECSTAHNKTSFTVNHSVVSIQGLKSGSFEEERKQRLRKPCPLHPDKPLDVYCLPCGQMLCLQCKLIEHNTHMCTDINPAATAQKNQLKANSQQLTVNIQTLEELISKCMQKKQWARKQKSSLMEQIINRVESFRQELEIYGESLAKSATNHYRKFIKKVEQEEDGLRIHLTKLTSLQLLTDRLISKATDVEILSSQHHYSEKFTSYCTKWSAPMLEEVEDMYLNKPNTKELALGNLFGYLSLGQPEYRVAERLSSFSTRHHDDNGKLPHLSPSGRIYDAELDMQYGVLSRPVIKTDFKDCIEYISSAEKPADKLDLSTLVLSKPKLISSKHCTFGNGSIIRMSSMPNNNLALAIFQRNKDSSQTRHCTRVRIQLYDLYGQIKLDVPFGSVCYGLATDAGEGIVVSGGEFLKNKITFLNKDGKLTKVFSPSNAAGGLAFDMHGNLAVASYKTIDFYKNDGELIKQYDDFPVNGSKRSKEFLHIRKELAFGLSDELFVADANTNSVRGYNYKGVLMFTYGDFSNNSLHVVNPRGIAVDSLGHVLVGDILTNSIQILSRNGGLVCKILQGMIAEPRCIAAFNGCYVAVGRSDGQLDIYQYLFDRNALASSEIPQKSSFQDQKQKNLPQNQQSSLHQSILSNA